MNDSNRQHYHVFSSVAGRWLLLLCLLFINNGYGQKYNFINLNVENGLVQSQVTVFTQNKNNELLIGTFGGLSIFDGTNFVNYSKSNGLIQNGINTLSCDRKYNTWIGTNNGISRFDGKQFRTYYVSAKPEENIVIKIETDAANNVWALTNFGKLYRFDGKAFKPDPVIDTVTTITLDKAGNLWASSYPKGIFIFKGNKWQKEIAVTDRSFFLRKIFFGAYSGSLYGLGFHGLQVVDSGKFKTPDWVKTFPARGGIVDIMEDSKGNIWLSLADGGGAWMYDKKVWTHYTYANGFTDENVKAFYEDTEKNIWLGTDGSGIYRYTGSLFTYYDRSPGFAPSTVLGITQDRRGNMFFISSSAGLYKLTDNVPQRLSLSPYISKSTSVLTDPSGNLWIGTSRAGIWYYDGKQAKPYKPSIEKGAYGIVSLIQEDNTIWVASLEGLFKLQRDSFSRENINLPVYSACSINKDSLLIGTYKGVFIYNTAQQKLLPKPIITNSSILCMTSDAYKVYIGTDDKGLLILEKATGKLSAINQKSGLSCNYVYNVLCDHSGNIWVGTGCGIDKLTYSQRKYHIRSFGRSDGLLGVESNANASFEDREGYLWFATTKGVFRYNPYVTGEVKQAPKVVLQSVKLFSKELPEGKYADSIIPFTNLSWNPVLPTNQNHLSFTFKGIYLSNPEKVRYRYQLVGIDKNYTETDQTTVVYPNLPPGEYLFKVWASDAMGNWYNNAISYPFVINTPYYTTWYFRLGMGFLVIGLFLGGVYYRNRQKELRRRWEEKLREEEQAMVRKKTAEDFHDEIGNKLTRINLLATIAEGKLQQPEVRNILQQIQQNVASLYNGSKDIIWSLQPESDYLDEIIFRIKQNTADLLQDTPIRFVYQQQLEMDIHIKLPIDYSRNLTMIFKEAVNNAVKHARASEIIFSVKKEEEQILLELKDDGVGFDQATSGIGNGLGNMNNRAGRIGVKLELDSILSKGTVLRARLKILK